MTNNRRGERENCGEREERKRAHTGAKRTADPASRSNPVHSTSCLRINCLQFIHGTVEVSFAQTDVSQDDYPREPSVPRLFCENNYGPDETDHVSLLSGCSSASDAHNGAQYRVRFRFRDFRATRNTLKES